MLAASKLTVAESQVYEPGSNAVVNRLAETLLVQLVRYIAKENGYRSGFLALLAHEKISKVIQLMHEKPHHPWKLEDLAQTCGVSRTVLCEEFSRCIGLAPIQYLTECACIKPKICLLAVK